MTPSGVAGLFGSWRFVVGGSSLEKRWLHLPCKDTDGMSRSEESMFDPLLQYLYPEDEGQNLCYDRELRIEVSDLKLTGF